MSNDVEWIKLNGGGAHDHTTLVKRGANTATIQVSFENDIQDEEYSRSDMVIDTPQRGRIAIFDRTNKEAVKLTWLCQNCYSKIVTERKRLDIAPVRFQSCRFCGNPSAKIAVSNWLIRYGGVWGDLVDKGLADKVESCADDELDDLLKVTRLVAIKRGLYSRYEDNDE
jgi:hypothetical protein